jgi:hypothetical protein
MAAPASLVRRTPLRGSRDLFAQRHMRVHPGDDGIAFADKGGDHTGADAAFGAVKAVGTAVLVAGLSAAFFLKRNPRLDFRTHSNLAKPTPPSPGAHPSSGHDRRRDRRVDKRGACFTVKARARRGKLNWRGWGQARAFQPSP